MHRGRGRLVLMDDWGNEKLAHLRCHIGDRRMFRSGVQGLSAALFNDFRAGLYIPVVSDVTAAEVLAAPAFVRNLHVELLTLSAEAIAVTEESLSLVVSYENEVC